MPIHSSLFTVEVTFLQSLTLNPDVFGHFPSMRREQNSTSCWDANNQFLTLSTFSSFTGTGPLFLFQCFILFAYFCFLLSSLFFWHFHLTITTILGVKGCPLYIISEGLTVNAFTFTPTQNKKFRGHGLFSQLPPQLLSRVSFLVPNAGIVTQELYVQKTRKQSPRQPATEIEERC